MTALVMAVGRARVDGEAKGPWLSVRAVARPLGAAPTCVCAGSNGACMARAVAALARAAVDITVVAVAPSAAAVTSPRSAGPRTAVGCLRVLAWLVAHRAVVLQFDRCSLHRQHEPPPSPAAATMSAAESSALVPARRGLFASPPVRNGVHLGLSFCAVFMAFSVSQNFQTSSDHKEAGSTALGILCTITATEG